jgi:hypothetical protein
LDRRRTALFTYVALMAAFVVDFILIFLFPGYPVFMALLGPIFVLLGVQIVYFSREHARIWEGWGAPSHTLFLFVGFSFIVLGFAMTFGAL